MEKQCEISISNCNPELDIWGSSSPQQENERVREIYREITRKNLVRWKYKLIVVSLLILWLRHWWWNKLNHLNKFYRISLFTTHGNDGSKGALEMPPRLGLITFFFMEFSTNILQNNRFSSPPQGLEPPPIWKILDLPLLSGCNFRENVETYF